MKPGSLCSLLIMMIILFSCKKENTKVDNISNFGFTANSINYKWDFVPGPSFDSTDVFFMKTLSPNTNDSMYVLAGINQFANIKLECAIHTPKLKAGTYQAVTLLSDKYIESTFLMNGKLYGAKTDDVITVTITSIDRNYASGTFTAVMHDLTFGGLQELRIWNGYFNGVEIPE